MTNIADNAHHKNAGKACLNLAVANELMNRNDSALAWAKKAYTDHDNKQAEAYVKKLQYRLNVE